MTCDPTNPKTYSTPSALSASTTAAPLRCRTCARVPVCISAPAQHILTVVICWSIARPMMLRKSFLRDARGQTKGHRFEGISFMPLPYWVGHFNMRITNRLMNRLAPRLPGFGVVVHTGRTSNRTYHTTVNVFRHSDGFIIALTYGRNSDWVRNVLASGTCKLITRGKVWRLTNPRIFHDESRTIAQGPVHLILSILKVSD